MSNAMWDWWFGDSPITNNLEKASRYSSLGLRRLSITLAATGACALSSLSGGCLSTVEAGEPSQKLVVSPISFGWSNATSLAVLIADNAQEGGRKNETGERGSTSAETAS